MRIALRELVQKVDNAIRAGELDLARAELRHVQSRKVPRALALQVAALARRANLPDIGIRILHPVVRPSNPSAQPASDLEKAEYAAALTYIGASDEALDLLSHVDSQSHPQVMLYHSFALFAQWEYRTAIPLLSRYIASPELTDYQRLVGKVNLAAALVNEHEHAAANRTLAEILKATEEGRLQLLHGNALELAAQNAIYEKRWKEASGYLERAEKTLERGVGLSLLFVKKWKAIARLLQEGPGTKRMEELGAIRNEARERKHWETVRECDLFDALVRKDEAVALRVYFGTPFRAYRDRVIALFGAPLEIPAEYSWEMGGSAPEKNLLDLFSGRYRRNGARLKAGQVLHRLLITLASDFYTPYRLPLLFGKIYHGEYFNPSSSPPRVYRVIRRLREWLAENSVPIEIPEADNTYRLVARRPINIRTRPSLAQAPALDANLKLLKETWDEHPFSAAQAGKVLRLSPRSALRLLQHAQESGSLERSGGAANTRYRFVVGRK